MSELTQDVERGWDKLKQRLTKKYGPLPGYAWLAVALVLIWIWWKYRNKLVAGVQSSGTVASAPSVAPAVAPLTGASGVTGVATQPGVEPSSSPAQVPYPVYLPGTTIPTVTSAQPTTPYVSATPVYASKSTALEPVQVTPQPTITQQAQQVSGWPYSWIGLARNQEPQAVPQPTISQAIQPTQEPTPVQLGPQVAIDLGGGYAQNFFTDFSTGQPVGASVGEAYLIQAPEPTSVITPTTISTPETVPQTPEEASPQQVPISSEVAPWDEPGVTEVSNQDNGDGTMTIFYSNGSKWTGAIGG